MKPRISMLLPLVAVSLACGGPPVNSSPFDMTPVPQVGTYEVNVKIDKQWPNRGEGQISDCVATPKPPANFPIWTAEKIRFVAVPKEGKPIILKDGCKPVLSFQLPPGVYELIHTSITGRIVEEGGKVTGCTFSATNQGGSIEDGKTAKDDHVFVGGCGPGYVGLEVLN